MKIKIELISGVEGDCVCINGYRVAGPKPWGGGKIIKTWDAQSDDIEKVIRHLTSQSSELNDVCPKGGDHDWQHYPMKPGGFTKCNKCDLRR